MHILYLEFLYPIRDYLKTLKLNEFLFDIGLPILIGTVVGYLIFEYNCSILTTSADSLFKTVITLLSILIGFTVSSITILTSTGHKLEQIQTKRKIGKTTINLYQLTNIIFIFTLFSEIITLVINLIAVIMISYGLNIIENNLNELLILDLVLLSHVLLLNIRNMSNFYFILHINKPDN
jgi:hypothetical protein